MSLGRILWPLTHPQGKAISFGYQIDRMTRALAEAGWQVIVGDPGKLPQPRHWGHGNRMLWPLRRETPASKVRELIRTERVTHVILHGYLDMFPWIYDLFGLEVPVLWWGQTSGASLLRTPVPQGYPFWVVPLTERSKRYFEQYLPRAGFPAEMVTEPVPHAVEHLGPLDVSERIAAKQHYRAFGRFVIGSVGVNTIRKQLPRLLMAFAEVSERMPKATLLLKTTAAPVDEGPHLARVAEDLGVKNVLFEESDLPPAEMRRLYASMDLYVHAAEWEGFGIPVAEAMALGVPVLTPPIQGAGEIVPDDRFLVRDADAPAGEEAETIHVRPAALAERIEALAGDDDALSAMGRAALAHARESFSPQAVLKRWNRVLLEAKK